MSFKDMPLDTTLQVGDIVTITGPGEHDVLVREVTGVRENGEPEVTGHLYPHSALSYFIIGGRTLTRIQRPVPALPTVEGVYILTTKSGNRLVRKLVDGEWRFGTGASDDRGAVQARLESGATLIRVIPADEVKRPEVDVEAATSAFLDLWVASTRGVKEDFGAVLLRVLEGEFDL